MAFGNATKGYVKKHSGGGGGGGTTNYSELTNKPQINGVTLDGNKTSADLGIAGGGGVNMVVYDENYATSTAEEVYDLSSKLNELGFTGGDLAIITCLPIYESTEGEGIALTVLDSQYYNTISSTRFNSYAKGLSATLTTNIPYWNTAKLRFWFSGSGNNHVKISIRIIKAPTNNN